jgi:hypothetical protein
MPAQIIQTQLAWFYENSYAGSFEDFSQKLKSKLGESKNTQYIPVPSNAPGEIPRLILMYENFNINVSKIRLDLHASNFESVKDLINKISSVIIDELKVKITRVGYVNNYFVENDIDTLKSFFNDEQKAKLQDAKELNIRVNKRKTILTSECNVMENISTGFISKREENGSETKKNGLIVMKDINTIPENLAIQNLLSTEFENLLSEFNTQSKESFFVTL